MQQVQWQQVEQIFLRALERRPAERNEFICVACAGDEAIRREVESLLASHENADGFMDSPVFEDGLKVVADSRGKSEAGQRAGAYRIVREIGRGGMGAVYLAERADEQYNKQVALKFVSHGVDSNFMLDRFFRERQILANLDHPNIARLVDGGTTEDGTPYLAMDYVEGESIDAYCDEKRLSTGERLRLFLSVCSAIHYAHQNLVIHRDIKPANILVTEDGTPKLLDFGIAKLLEPELSQTADRAATIAHLMTPQYASPEQTRGETITTASDVYSLGVLLYRLLTGHHPYTFKTFVPSEVERIICEQNPERPSTIVTHVEELVDRDGTTKTITPESVSAARDSEPARLRRRLEGDLDNIILMAMRKDPQRRYSSVEQFAQDIRRHLEGRPVIARKDTFAYRGGKFIRRHKVGVAAAALVAVAIIAGIVATVWQARVAARERDIARIEKAKSDRINTFLQDTMGFANPSYSSPNTQKEHDPTIADALEEASRRVETELGDLPEVKALMHRTIGETYLHQARFDLAEPHLRAALGTYQELVGEQDPEFARSADLLAALLILKGDYPMAQSLSEKALTVYRREYPGGRVPAWWYVAGLSESGLLKMTTGDIASAEAPFREALNIAPKLVGNDRALVAIVLGNLGKARESQGDLDEAESLYRRSIEVYRALPGRQRLELGTSLTYLGDILKTKGNYAEAEPVLREALAVVSRLVGDANPYLCMALNSLGHLLYLKGNYADAESQVNRALDIFRQTVPSGHLGFAGPLTTLGLIMTKTGRLSEAERNLRNALAIRTRVLPKGHWQVAFTESALGECLVEQKRYQDAAPLLVRSYEDLKGTQGGGNPRTVEALNRLIKLYEASGNRNEAARYKAILTNASP